MHRPDEMDGTSALGGVAPTLKSYTKPVLVFFGEVRNLTMSGGSQPTENPSPGNTASCSNNKDRSCLVSDRSAKHCIEQVGKHPLGFGLYLFDYKPEYQKAFGTGRRFGVMADEVQAVVPEAVLQHPLGIKMVDYDLLGIDLAIR